jgi:hypothetical protein
VRTLSVFDIGIVADSGEQDWKLRVGRMSSSKRYQGLVRKQYSELVGVLPVIRFIKSKEADAKRGEGVMMIVYIAFKYRQRGGHGHNMGPDVAN